MPQEALSIPYSVLFFYGLTMNPFFIHFAFISFLKSTGTFYGLTHKG